MMSGSRAESGANFFRFAKLGAPDPKPPASQRSNQPWTVCRRLQNIDRDSCVRRRTYRRISCTNPDGTLLTTPQELPGGWGSAVLE